MKKVIQQGGIQIEMTVNTKEIYGDCIEIVVEAQGLKENYNSSRLVHIGDNDPERLESAAAKAELDARNWARAQENINWKEDTLRQLGFE